MKNQALMLRTKTSGWLPLFGGLLLLLISPFSAADKTNFRVGLGNHQLEIHPDNSQFESPVKGLSLFAEFPQNDFLASRFLMYRGINSELDHWGYETQMMIGYGVATPGFRIHIGPTWRRDVLTLSGTNGDGVYVQNGWNWQFGVGLQYQLFTVELTNTFLDRDDYGGLYNEIGENGKPRVNRTSLLLSYQL